MNLRTSGILLFVVFNVAINTITSELITASIAIGSAIGSWYNWDKIKDNTICRFSECCNEDYLPFNMAALKHSMTTKMFGQPLVNELINILTAHKKSVNSVKHGNKKALVISLHGWTGVGKNYAATMIAEALYKKGVFSEYVKIFMGKKDFDCSRLEKSKRDLFKSINTIVKSCGTSLIIFDEIHDMCPTMLDAIMPMIDHHHNVDGVDYRNAIFIFISNIGGQEIANILLDLYDKGLSRSDASFHHFEQMLRSVAYFTGGFEKSSTIAHHLIDYYIPFLPLEQKHVRSCARQEFKDHGVPDPTEQMMEDALSVITYGPDDRKIFANNGCKRFTRHVPYVIQKHLKNV